MNKRVGDLIYWSIEDLETTKEKLHEMGFESYIPRNDYRSAMIKTLRRVLKGDDRFYRKFKDHNEGVFFAVVQPVVNEEDYDIDFKREVVIRLDKKTGSVEYRNKENASEEFMERIQLEYEHAQITIDSTQFRKIITDVIKKDCFGVSLRKSGGIYFIDEKFDSTREKLQELFSAFPGQATLSSVPIYNDKGTEDALEEATSKDIFSDIEIIINELKEKTDAGDITARIIEHRQVEADKVFEKIQVHEKHLRLKAETVKTRLMSVQRLLKDAIDEATVTSPEAFMSELKKL